MVCDTGCGAVGAAGATGVSPPASVRPVPVNALLAAAGRRSSGLPSVAPSCKTGDVSSDGSASRRSLVPHAPCARCRRGGTRGPTCAHASAAHQRESRCGFASATACLVLRGLALRVLHHLTAARRVRVRDTFRRAARSGVECVQCTPLGAADERLDGLVLVTVAAAPQVRQRAYVTSAALRGLARASAASGLRHRRRRSDHWRLRDTTRQRRGAAARARRLRAPARAWRPPRTCRRRPRRRRRPLRSAGATQQTSPRRNAQRQRRA